ncbi:hypothetical protein KIK84_07390 [Curvibacter sp. CHRR-16]|uniref:hypothetical protein n=1 Tax=Curvibacter sp. CHRR-16 TaxID=2835872 RepID=UPI001BD9ED66|nr:hypothetical protein [Curvibacter sp. CHRR-16]MBT0570143.1 hypothetical protein [Curvibacter sp. CHRR-16]
MHTNFTYFVLWSEFMRISWKNWALGLATAATLINGALAAETKCFFDSQTGGAFMMGSGDKSRAINPQPAANDWYDVIYRGDLFYCPGGSGTIDCSHSWGKTQSTTYSWSWGLSTDLGGIKTIGKALGLVSLSAEYGVAKTYTTAFTETIRIKPGYYARPIQVVARRWTQGKYQGVWFRTDSTGVEYYISAWKKCQWYWWNDGYNWGKWTSNLEKYRYDTYDVKPSVSKLI